MAAEAVTNVRGSKTVALPPPIPWHTKPKARHLTMEEHAAEKMAAGQKIVTVERDLQSNERVRRR